MHGGVQEPGAFLAVEGGGARRDLWGRAVWTEFRCQTAPPCDSLTVWFSQAQGASGVTGDSCARRCGRCLGPCQGAGKGHGHSIRSVWESWFVRLLTLAQADLEEICCMWHRPLRRVFLCRGSRGVHGGCLSDA